MVFCDAIEKVQEVEVKDSPLGGRGVFSLRSYEPGELIERAPVLVIPELEEVTSDMTLYNYTFAWGNAQAVALGYGSIYNHSYSPNALYRQRIETGCIEYVAYRPIREGEEITINYNKDPQSKEPLWFSVNE